MNTKKCKAIRAACAPKGFPPVQYVTTQGNRNTALLKPGSPRAVYHEMKKTERAEGLDRVFARLQAEVRAV
jgi:hypothetical protein